MNTAMTWIDAIRGNDSHREVARKIGTTHSTLARQVNLNQLTFEIVRAVARAYNRPVVSELIATGLLTHEDAGIEGLERALQTATDAQLVLEVSRRLSSTSASTLWDAPISKAVSASAKISHMGDHRAGSAEELPAVAMIESNIPDVDEADYP